MDRVGSHQKLKILFIGAFVLICLASVTLHWVMAPESLYHTVTGLMLSYLTFWSIIFLWSEASTTEQVKRFFLTTVSLSLTIGFLEIFVVAQAIDFRNIFETPVSEPWEHPANLSDPRLLHIHTPYDRWVWHGIEYRYDKYGLRNQIDLKFADLLVVGDSFVAGLGIPAADILTSHLSRQLDRPVANLAQSWYGPQQELELLKRYGVPLNPKVCVWVFFEGNDLDDLLRYRKVTQDWKTYSRDFHSFRQRSFTKNFLIAVKRQLRRIQVQKNFPIDISLTEQSGYFISTSGEKIRMTFHYKGHFLSASDFAALEELRVILEQAYKLCRTSGAKFLFAFAPTKFRVYRNFAEFDSRAQPRYWVVNDLPQKIKALVQEEIPDGKFVDLTPALVEQAKQGSLVYFTYDSHWSAAGHQVVASVIANVITQWEKSEPLREMR